MPGLVAFNRRWGIGSDDFVFPALIEFMLRAIWFIAVLVVYLKHKYHLGCNNSQLLPTYFTVLLVGHFIVLFLDVVIGWISAKGTITQTRPRRHFTKVLYLRLFVVLLEIIWNGIGTKWAFTFSSHACVSEEVVILVQVVVIFSWVMVGAILLGIFLVFDPIGTHSQAVCSHRVSDVEHGEPQPLYINLNAAGAEKAKRVWEWRMRILCCCTSDDQSRSAYSDIAKLFAEYFEDIDLVPSDIAAGLYILHQKQKQERATRTSTSQQFEHYSIQSPDSLTSTGAVQGSVLSSPGVFTPVAQQFWMTTGMACHIMKYALGSYGWLLFLYSDGIAGFCKLWSQVRCCACCCKRPSYIVDDNCCHCDTAALMSVTGLTDEDLIYVSFHNRVYEVPFYVAVDHQTCSIVVAIRGSLSPYDALTDLTADCDHVTTDTCPQGMHCHRGMLRASQFVHQKLEESHALSDAFALYQSYSLVITGHSLGAGTAALLAILLRPIYPNLRCFAFSPPGGMLSIDGVKHTEDFVFSITMGDDLVPRLSVPNMEDTKKKLLSCILDCEQPKYRIFLLWIFSCFHKNQSAARSETTRNALSRPLLEHFGPNNNSSGNYTTNSSQEGSSEGSVSSTHATAQSRHMSHIPLYPPGRILHLSPTDSDGYRAQWVTADYFNQIVITPRMLSDHLPHLVYKSLKQVSNNSEHFIP